MPNKIYDDEDKQLGALPGSHDDLGVHPERSEAETEALRRQFDAPSAGEPISNTGLAAAEQAGGEASAPSEADDTEKDSLFRKEAEAKNRAVKFLGSKKGKWVAGGVAAGGIGAVAFVTFLLPLKVMHIAENLQNTFFSSSEQAAEDMTNRLLAGYLINKVMPGMTGSCTSTMNVNRSCAVVSNDDGPVSVLYNAWRDNNLEGKLAEKHGLEIRREGGRYYVRSGDKTLFSGVRDERNPKLFEDKMFSEMNRKDVRREFLKAMESETFYKRIMYRFKYGSLMERKYGIVRCVIACEYKDDKADRKELRKIKFQAWVIQRVIAPMNEGYALAFQCSISGFDCAKEGSATVSEDGDKRTQFETDLRAKVGEVIGDGRMTKDKLASLQKDADEIRGGGLSNFLFKKIFGEGITKIAGAAVPGVGWIDSLSRIVDGLQSAGPAIKTMNYVVKSQAYVQTYMMYRTNADEVRDGGIHPEELGYVADSFSDDFGKDQNGGTAESSPYYHDVMGTRGVSTASLFPKAQAAAVYRCNDGSTIESGLCPEMAMGAATGAGDILSSTSDIFNAIPGLGAVADAWLATGGQIYDAVGDLLGSLLGAVTPSFIEEKAEEIGKEVAKWFSDKLIVNPLGDDPSGGRMFDMAAMGANVAGNDYAHYGLGAGKMSDQAANNIRYARTVEEQQEFSQKSFLARMFDTSSSYSMVSRLALATPTETSTPRTLTTTLLNPFGSISLSLPTSQKAQAAPIQNLDLGGVTQYGYSEKDEIFKVTDYEAYWKNNNCDDEAQLTAWGESAKVSDANGSFENDSPYRCKLVESIALSNCGYYTDDCLTPEELGEEGGEIELGAGSRFRIASYNVLGKSHTNPAPGQSEDSNLPDWDVRAARQVENIISNKIDIIGFQEFENDQQQYMDNQLSDYGRSRQGKTSDGIMWREKCSSATACTSFTKVDEGTWNSVYFEGQIQEPWVKLKDNTTGQELYVMNVHDPINRGHGNAQTRYENAKKHLEQAKKLLKNAPVLITGDFNNGYTKEDGAGVHTHEQTAYCVFTSSGSIHHAYDLRNKRTPKCPNPLPGNSGISSKIDHIYASTGLAVTKFFDIDKPQSASDHVAIVADVVIPTVSSGGGTDFVMASYNHPNRGNPNVALAKILEHELDVIGMQELGGDNYLFLRRNLKQKGYDLFPDLNRDGGGHCANSRSIFYKKERFSFVKSEIFDVPSYEANKHGPVPGYVNPIDCGGGERTKGGGRANIPIVWLNDVRTDQTIIVMNTHNLANCCGGGGERAARKRFLAAQIYVDKIKELNQSNPGVPVFFSGDFNEGTGVRWERGTNTTYERNQNNLLYCMLTKQTKIMFRAAGSRDQPCQNNREGIGGVDYIYSTPGVDVKWTKEFRDPSTNDSPHPVVLARLVVPGANNNERGKGGWSWPLKNNINNGPCYGGPSGHAGMDMNSSTADNPVYAMHSGKVVRKGYDAGGAGNFVTILADADFNGKPVYYSYEHLKSGSVRVGMGDKVEGGSTVVGIAGLTGNTNVGVSKAHLHIVTATTNTLGSYGNLGTTFDPMRILGSVNPAPGGYKCT